MVPDRNPKAHEEITLEAIIRNTRLGYLSRHQDSHTHAHTQLLNLRTRTQQDASGTPPQRPVPHLPPPAEEGVRCSDGATEQAGLSAVASLPQKDSEVSQV